MCTAHALAGGSQDAHAPVWRQGNPRVAAWSPPSHHPRQEQTFEAWASPDSSVSVGALATSSDREQETRVTRVCNGQQSELLSGTSGSPETETSLSQGLSFTFVCTCACGKRWRPCASNSGGFRSPSDVPREAFVTHPQGFLAPVAPERVTLGTGRRLPSLPLGDKCESQKGLTLQDRAALADWERGQPVHQ